MFQLSLLLLLDNYQNNCNNTISSVSVLQNSESKSHSLTWRDSFKETIRFTLSL